MRLAGLQRRVEFLVMGLGMGSTSKWEEKDLKGQVELGYMKGRIHNLKRRENSGHTTYTLASTLPMTS